jgi:hypothetical protein
MAVFSQQRGGQRQVFFEINPVNFLRPFPVRPVHLDFSVDPARTQNGGINEIRAVGSQNDHHFVERFDPIHLRAEHRHQRAQDAAVPPGPARAQNGFRLVDKNKRQKTFARFFAGARKQLPDLPLRFPHPHVQHFGPLDVEEIFRTLLPRLFAQLPRQVVGGRFAQQGLAAARGAMEQKTFRRRMPVGAKQVAVQKRQLDGIAHRPHRLRLAADLFPRKIRHPFQQMIPRLRLRHHLQRHPRRGIQPDLQPGLEPFLGQRTGPQDQKILHPAVLPHSQPAIGQQIENFRHRPAAFEAQIPNHHISFVQQHPRSGQERALRQAGVDRAIKFRAALANQRRVRLGQRQQRPHAIGGRGELVYHLVELFQRAPRLVVHLLHLRDAAPQIKELAAMDRVVRNGLGNQI